MQREVALSTIVLSLEESEVLSPPRIAVFEDFEHQIQIADSTRPDAYDETLSHYVDAGETKGRASRKLCDQIRVADRVFKRHSFILPS